MSSIVAMFRFHTGSIKKLATSKAIRLRLYVSIPYWFD